MILATDTQYGDKSARTAGVLFRDWADAEAASTHLLDHGEVADYEPGAFYKRELPLILALLEEIPLTPSFLIIDAYVYLDEAGRPGLGAYLFEALGSTVPVIGVAKAPFMGSSHAIALLRGKSTRPLYVTAAGIDKQEAAARIRSMHGDFRQPTMLKLADSLCRGHERKKDGH